MPSWAMMMEPASPTPGLLAELVGPALIEVRDAFKRSGQHPALYTHALTIHTQ